MRMGFAGGGVDLDLRKYADRVDPEVEERDDHARPVDDPVVGGTQNTLSDQDLAAGVCGRLLLCHERGSV